MRLVVLPQAMRIVVPPLTGNAINVIKDTALASVVAMPDLLKQATQAQALAANPTPLIGAAAIYLIILLPLVRLVADARERASPAPAADFLTRPSMPLDLDFVRSPISGLGQSAGPSWTMPAAASAAPASPIGCATSC